MLRITVDDKPATLRLQLEGRLAGSDVQVLRECWDNLARRPKLIRVDLTEVTSVDAAGRGCLADMHCAGAA